MNFLEACRELIAETGLAGGEPDQLDTVLGQTGDLANAVRWIRDANTQIDNLWFDWKYLWQQLVDAAGLPINTQDLIPASISSFRRWDRGAIWLDKGTGRPIKLRFEPWEVFRERAGVVQTSTPSVFTVLPTNALRVNVKARQTYAVTAEGWRRPTVLVADDDEPMMPAEYQRIIVARAAIFYANKVDAPEVLEGAEAEYLDLLDKLQSDQAPSFEFERTSAQDLDSSMETPGYQGGGALYPTR